MNQTMRWIYCLGAVLLALTRACWLQPQSCMVSGRQHTGLRVAYTKREQLLRQSAAATAGESAFIPKVSR